MKSFYLVLPLVSVLISVVLAEKKSDSSDEKIMLSLKKTARDSPLKVMSFNIRLNNPEDGFNTWSYRKKMVQSMILFHQADLIGVQESLNEQMDDLSILLPDHRSVGVGRDDGAKKGEFCGVFYNFNRLNQSAKRLCMKPIDKDIFIHGMKKLVDLDQEWVLSGNDRSL